MLKKKLLIGLVVVLIFVTLFFLNEYTNKKKEEQERNKYLRGKYNVEIVVKDYGKIDVELDADIAPITVTNFINLVNEKHYDNTTFHRIMEGFMIQGGDNPNRTINTIKGEFSSNGIENNLSHKRGVISMARAGGYPDSASDQFFIMHVDNTSLDGNYAAFGIVTSGMEVVDEIAKVPVEDNNGTVLKENQPIIESIRIINK